MSGEDLRLGVPYSTSVEYRRAVRAVAVKAAAQIFTNGDTSNDEVLRTASRFYQWIMEGDEE